MPESWAPWLRQFPWGTFVPHALEVVGCLLALFIICRAVAAQAASNVVRTVFGAAAPPDVERITREVTDARAEAAMRIERIQADTVREIESSQQSIRNSLRQVFLETCERQIPLTLVVNSPEEMQVLEAMLSRGNTRVVYRQIHTTRKTDRERKHEQQPTAWARILADEEDAIPCPTTTETPTPPTIAKRKASLGANRKRARTKKG